MVVAPTMIIIFIAFMAHKTGDRKSICQKKTRNEKALSRHHPRREVRITGNWPFKTIFAIFGRQTINMETTLVMSYMVSYDEHSNRNREEN